MPEKKDNSQQTEDKPNDWDDNNIKVVNYWMDYLSYCCLIYHFYLFKLKKIENKWAWILIVSTSLSSTFSLLQYENENEDLRIFINIFITFLTLLSTLISAWMKKQNYVEHISELSKYSLEINKLKGDVNSVIKEPVKNRMSYQDFIGKHKENIVNCLSVRPLISPIEWKETIYIITKYYPELAAYEYPWKKIPDYGENAMKTYERIKYKGLWRKIKNGYFCKRCFEKDSEFDRELSSTILNHDKNYYERLPACDFDRPSHLYGKQTYGKIEEGEPDALHDYDKFIDSPPTNISTKISVI